MEQFNSKRKTIVTGVYIVFPLFIMLWASNALAANQSLPFTFFTSQDQLEWTDIEEGGTGTGNPFTGMCNSTLPGIIIGDAEARNGDNDAYDNAFLTTVNSTFVSEVGTGDLTGNTYTAVPNNISGLAVTYQLFFSENTQCARLVLFFDNQTNSCISDTVRIATNPGSDALTTVLGTSSGDTSFTTADRWIVTADDDNDPDDPVITSVLYGPGSPVVTPSSVTQTVFECAGTEGIGATYDIEVPPGTTRCLMLFSCLADITGFNNTVAGALSAATLFDSNSLTGDLLSGLSPTELEECLNWDFGGGVAGCSTPEPPPVQTIIIPTLSEWGMIIMTGFFRTYCIFCIA